MIDDQRHEHMAAVYDVVVIGSGFGGAITAARLAEGGRSVAVLERGRRWRMDEFPRAPDELEARGYWQRDGYPGLIEHRTFRRVDVIAGAGVGGGSLVYYNVNRTAPARIFAHPRWPERIDLAALEPYYQRVKAMLESRPLVPPAGRGLPLRTEAFLDAARRLGKKPELLDLAVYTGPQRQNQFGVHQLPCTYTGNCLIGCPVHAKNTLDLTYIKLAEQHGAEVFPLHRVEYIVPAGQGYRVTFRRCHSHRAAGADAAAGAAGAASTADASGSVGSVIGRQVVVAAGVLGSTELLLRCRDVYKSLPALGGALGLHFSTNGNMLFAGAANLDRLVAPGIGPDITAGVDFESAEHFIVIEDVALPNPLFWYLEGFLPTLPGLGRKLRLVSRYMLQRFGLLEDGHAARDIDALFHGGRTGRFLPFLGVGTDAADGRMSLRKGQLDLCWSHRGSQDLFTAMERHMRALSDAAGGRYVPSPWWRWPLRKVLTAHPLGGCVLGDGPEGSVVDHSGESWAYPGLYVMDGSVIPTALGVNPGITIGALAERAAHWMLHGRELAAEAA